MSNIAKAAQTGAALWILNVWTNRFNKDTGYRGGGAKNMVEEFEAYGLSKNTMYAVGATKLSLAGLLLAGLRYPQLTRPAAVGLGSLMLGAIGMHVKVKDPIKRSLPAISVFTLSAVAAILSEANDRKS